LSELQEEVAEVVCECLITAVAPLEVGDGKEKDRREIKIASGVQNCVEGVFCILAAILCNVTAVTVCSCKIRGCWMWLLQATAMTEQCTLCWIRGDMHAKQKPSNVGDARAH